MPSSCLVKRCYEIHLYTATIEKFRVMDRGDKCLVYSTGCWFASRQPGIPVKFNIGTERNLLVPDSPVMKICAPRTDERHLLHSLDFLFASAGQDL